MLRASIKLQVKEKGRSDVIGVEQPCFWVVWGLNVRVSSWRLQKENWIRSSLEATLALPVDDDLDFADSAGVVPRSGASPLVSAGTASGWEAMAFFGAAFPSLGVASAAPHLSLRGPTPPRWATGAIGFPVCGMVGFCWLPARGVVLIAAAFWESKTSQAFSPLSSLVLQNRVSVGDLDKSDD